MDELLYLLKKVKTENLVSYLIYDEDSTEETIESYGQKVKDSYDALFTRLESLYDDADRNDNQLFEAIADFAMVHDDTYFESGMLVGFQLYKSMEQGYKNHDISDVQDILNQKLER